MNLETSMLPKGKFFPKSCTICGVHFNSARHFTVHSQRKNICRPKPYTCRKCGKIFNYYWNLIAHEKRKYPCGLKVPKVKNKIVSYIQTEKCNFVSGHLHQENVSTNAALLKKLASLTCSKCGESFRSHSSYYRHRKKCPLNQFHKDINTVQNKVYSFKPKTETSFTLTEAFRTGICRPSNKSEKFPEPARTERQICRTENDSDSKSSCILIDTFQNKVARMSNILSEQEESLSSGKTSLENEKVNSKKSVNAKVEKGKYEFACEVCGYICYNVYTWCKHMKKHKCVKIPKGILKCPVCPETFCTPYILFRHQRKLKHWREAHMLTSNQYKNDDKKASSSSILIKQVENKDSANYNGSSVIDSSMSSNGADEYKKLMCNERLLSMKLRDIAQMKKKKLNKMRIKKINKAINIQSSKRPRKHPDKCPVCGKFVTVLSSCRHFQKKTDHFSFICKWCSKRFKYFREMTRHQQMKHRDLLPYECMRCKQRFSKRSSTLHHISQLHKDVPNYTLVKDLNMKGDSLDLEENSPNICLSEQKSNTLNKQFCINKTSNLQEYICSKPSDCEKTESSHGNDPKSYCFMCSVCNQVFDNVAGYVAHSLNHFNSNQIDPSEISESKPYECEICMQKFSHHQKVQAHFLWHLKMIKSPFSESAYNNNNNIIASVFNTKDNTHGKARFQIAKKSIFSKMPFDSSLTESTFRGYNLYSETPNNNKCLCANCHCQIDCSSPGISLCSQDFTCSNTRSEQKLEKLDCNKSTPKKSSQNRENSHIELHNYCQLHNNEQKVEPVEELAMCGATTNTKETNPTEGPNNVLESQNFHTQNKSFSNMSDCPNNSITEFKSENHDNYNEKSMYCDPCQKSCVASVARSQLYCMHSYRSNSTGDKLESLNKEHMERNCSNKMKCKHVHCPYSTTAEVAKLSQSSENIHMSNEKDIVSLPEDTDVSKSPCVLRSNFSELLYLLIGDPELMQHLGWGEKEIDVILEEVLHLLGQTPVESKVKLEKLRLNISLLLQVCIKDSVVDGLKNNNSSIDDVVSNILQLCKSGLDSWNELSLLDN